MLIWFVLESLTTYRQRSNLGAWQGKRRRRKKNGRESKRVRGEDNRRKLWQCLSCTTTFKTHSHICTVVLKHTDRQTYDIQHTPYLGPLPALLLLSLAMSWPDSKLLNLELYALVVLRNFLPGERLTGISPYHYPAFYKPISPRNCLIRTYEYVFQLCCDLAVWFWEVTLISWALASSVSKRVCPLILKKLLAPTFCGSLKPHFQHGVKM